MIDPELTALLWRVFLFACCGAVVAIGGRLWNRNTPGPQLDQAAAIGALVGAAFGALIGVFESMLNRLD